MSTKDGEELKRMTWDELQQHFEAVSQDMKVIREKYENDTRARGLEPYKPVTVSSLIQADLCRKFPGKEAPATKVNSEQQEQVPHGIFSKSGADDKVITIAQPSNKVSTFEEILIIAVFFLTVCVSYWSFLLL